jgi:hypothetical protein
MTAQHVAETTKPKRTAKKRAPSRGKARKFDSHLFNGVSDALGTCTDAVAGVGKRVVRVFSRLTGPAPEKTRKRATTKRVTRKLTPSHSR